MMCNKPFLKWAGGKRKLIPFIVSLCGETHNTRLIEPFMGGGSVFAGTHFKSYILNDINPDLITLYKSLKDNEKQFLDELSTLFIKEYNNKESFNMLRDIYNSIPEGDSKRSALFVYLNKHCFNGMYRVNSKGGYNIPFANYKKVTMPKQEIMDFGNKLRNSQVELYSMNFEDIMNMAQKGDIIYCDPPYTPISNTSSFTSYAKENFGIEQHKTLVHKAIELKKHGVKTLISNNQTPETLELYKDANIVSIDVRRMIAANGNRDKVKEIIAIYD
jgi:DNA adenine methylase